MMLFIEPPCSKTSLGNPYCPLVLDVQLPAIRVICKRCIPYISRDF